MRPFIIGLCVNLMCLLALTTSGIMAELTECGTILPPQQIEFELQRMSERATIAQPLSDDPYIIPLAMHIVRRSDGSGGFTPEKVDAAIYAANALYAQMGLGLFRYVPIDYVDNDQYFYHMDNSSNQQTLRETNVIPEAVNIYFVPESDTSNFGYCGLSSFSGSYTQGIIINNSCADTATNKSTLAHEIGHYFDLYHTHETAFDYECPDGSNCDWAGDLICDTPADPGLYVNETYFVSEYPDCEFIPYTPPPEFCDDTPYDPSTENLMSYSRKLCRDEFTPMQAYWVRNSIEFSRTELAYSIGGLMTIPHAVSEFVLPLGTVQDTTIRIAYVLYDTLEILSALSATGLLDISGTTPASLSRTDTLTFDVSCSIAQFASECDLGAYVDTIIFATTHPEVPTLRIPVDISVAFSRPATANNTFATSCMAFSVPNTPGLGNMQDSALVMDAQNLMFDGTLLVGLVDGGSTMIYADAYGREDFSTVDGYSGSIDESGRLVKSLRFASNDGRIHGEVSYTYSWSSDLTDSCNYLLVDYVLSNPCDTALTLVSGMLCDFDIGEAWDNDATVNHDDQMAIVSDEASGAACALTPLYTCGEGSNLVIKRAYQLSSLGDEYVYDLLTGPSSVSGYFANDVAAMISFGETTLPPDADVYMRAAILYSADGASALVPLRERIAAHDGGMPWDVDADCVDNDDDNCPEVYNPDQADGNGNEIGDACDFVCGDADGNYIVNIADAVYLIGYIFGGGPAPDPLTVGDSDCNEIVNIADAVYLISYIFGGGPAPCAACP